MSWPVNDIPPLGEREIAGAGAYNRLLRFVLNFRPLSPFLTLNPDGKGSYTIDLDFASLATAMLDFVSPAMLRGFDFIATVADSMLYVNGGRIFLPDRTVIATAITQAVTDADNGKMIYVRMTSANAAEIVLDSPVTHTMQTGGGNYRVTLPLALLSYADGVFSLRYLHIGAFELTQEPYFYVSGYNRAASQILAHEAGADGLCWIANCCDQSSSSASGSSSSSGSVSSSSSTSGSTSSSASASSSSSSGGGGEGVLVVTSNSPTPYGFEGTYTLESGDPHDCTGVWRLNADCYISCTQGARYLHYNDGFMPVQYGISSPAGADPTTWVSPDCGHALIAPAMGYEAIACYELLEGVIQ